AAAQDLDDPLDLRLPSNDRVELVASRELSEVATELVQQRSLGRLLRGGLRFGLRARVVEQALDLGAQLLDVRGAVFEHMLGGPLALDEQAQKQVLGAG